MDEPDSQTPKQWVDLSLNTPGRGVFVEAARRRYEQGGTAARSWQIGAEGEYKAGEMLSRFTVRSWWQKLLGRPPRWRVLHSVALYAPDGTMRGDIDHVLIGPPGVVTINTKHHRRGTVLVDGDDIVVNGYRTTYAVKARREADRARTLIAAALDCTDQADLAARLVVQPLLLLVGTMPQVRRWPAGVEVAGLQQLRRTVEALPVCLDLTQTEAVFELARRSTAWHVPPTHSHRPSVG